LYTLFIDLSNFNYDLIIILFKDYILRHRNVISGIKLIQRENKLGVARQYIDDKKIYKITWSEHINCKYQLIKIFLYSNFIN
jgi:hypothetical protein